MQGVRDGVIVGVTVPHFASCLISRLPTSRTHAHKITETQCDSYAPAMRVRADMRDELRVLDR
jgi:hypothetical protein